MTTKHEIDNLWREMRRFINEAYALDRNPSDDNSTGCLRDYAENISWSDDLAALLGREAANERQHRSNRPSVSGFSAETAAKLIIMRNVRGGAALAEMPKATTFLVLRQTAVEAEVIGWLIKARIDPRWLEAIESYDYAKLMQPA